jgi:dihydroorotase
MRTLIHNATIINEGVSFTGSLLIDSENISEIFRFSEKQSEKSVKNSCKYDHLIDATSLLLIPGAIDDQVHFREPGATQKGDIHSESAAAALGGVTSFMDMPNNTPPACTLPLLEKKYDIARGQSYTNYSFYLGADNSNIDQIISVNPSKVCGVKVFMGSSTGNMLVDNPDTLERIFRECPTLIATHCEEESIIQENLQSAISKYGADSIPMMEHPHIRSREACIASTKKAIELAIKYGSRLHILHISTLQELELIRQAHLINPKITAEICVHYLFFNDNDYSRYGTLIKCNPSIKSREDMIALRRAITTDCRKALNSSLSGYIGAIATDHAPHLYEEKMRDYLHSPSGIPTIQHSVRMMFQLVKEEVITPEQVVECMCHAPARTFRIKNRGYIRKGYRADIVLINPSASPDKKRVSKENIAYKCGWSPLEGMDLDFNIEHTFINGIHIVDNGTLTGRMGGERLEFDNNNS